MPGKKFIESVLCARWQHAKNSITFQSIDQFQHCQLVSEIWQKKTNAVIKENFIAKPPSVSGVHCTWMKEEEKPKQIINLKQNRWTNS